MFQGIQCKQYTISLMRIKTNIKVLIIGSFVLFIIFLYNIYKIPSDIREANEYIESLNINLKGKISSITPLGHDSGLLSINISNSNHKYFDDRKSNYRNFIVIKDSVAEIYFVGIGFINLNDDLNLVGDKIFIYDDSGKQIYSTVVQLPPKNRWLSYGFYKELESNHKL
jgi:hypothetical protein